MTERYKIVIVGAASLRGKELNEVLADSIFSAAEFVLIDDEPEVGQLESAGDEVTFIRRIERDSFEQADFVFFAGAPGMTQEYWKTALGAGASIVDLSYALEGQPGVLVRAPWLLDRTAAAHSEDPNLSTSALIPAHPVALALGLLLARLQELGEVRVASATVLEPASEYGRAAMDELHQQTVGLLSFQSLPKDIYDTQVAFNAVPSLGESAKINLGESEARIRRHYALLSGGQLPDVGIQLLHAPVFHGQSISLAIELDQPQLLEHVKAALGGEHIDVVPGDVDPPNNLSSAGQSDVMVRVRTQNGLDEATSRFWIWASLDNLKIASLNALACAIELRRLRPQGKVQ
ncbi:MAG TPA: Asd/ArgC dimerization domain-containing protein [Silvibacterium sp.]|jgi:aspartate-semialdehyde dehydrogenase|nr:Asd/ArgC dimerization domain-containing protein [Silvibacterium sp.]